MSHHDYIYCGDPIPELSEKENPSFFLNLQKAIICSLEKRSLLTSAQCGRCIAQLEKQHHSCAL